MNSALWQRSQNSEVLPFDNLQIRVWQTRRSLIAAMIFSIAISVRSDAIFKPLRNVAITCSSMSI